MVKALLFFPVISVGALILASPRLYFLLVLAVLLQLWERLLLCCMFLQSFLTPSLILECRETWFL
jgi:hypothetical protein